MGDNVMWCKNTRTSYLSLLQMSYLERIVNLMHVAGVAAKGASARWKTNRSQESDGDEEGPCEKNICWRTQP